MSPRLSIAVAAFLFSTGGIAIKAVGLNGYQVASFRSGVAAIVLLLAVPAARRAFGWRPLLVGVAYAATLVSFVLANRMTTSANAIYLQSAAPLYLLLLAPWLLREPVRRRDFPIIVAVIVGLVMVFMGDDAPSTTAPDPATGNLFGAGSGLAYAFTIAGLRWLGRHDDGSSTIAAVILGNIVACLAVLPLALPVTAVTMGDLLGIGYLGVFQIAVAYLLVTRGLRKVPALDASLLLLVETAFNPIWVWLFLHETPSAMAVAGGLVIVVATFVQAVRGAPAAPTPEPA